MNNINIAKRTLKQSPKEFVLGNGKRIQFTSKRTANAFIAETNRYLTKCLVTLNLVYVDLFREYRSTWFVITNTNSGNETNYRSVAQGIRDNLSAADFVFEKFAATIWGSNDPFFAFNDLRKIASFLFNAANQLADFHKKRNTTASIHICQVLADRCVSVREKLSNYGFDL